MRYFIYSTLSNSHRFTQWTRPSDKNMGPEVIGTPVEIKGGANLATNPDSKNGRYTPRGIMTEVTEQQHDYLMGCTAFKRHMERGFITVSTSRDDPEDIARGMQARDHAAPLTPDSPELNKQDENAVKPMTGLTSRLVGKVKEALS